MAKRPPDPDWLPVTIGDNLIQQIQKIKSAGKKQIDFQASRRAKKATMKEVRYCEIRQMLEEILQDDPEIKLTKGTSEKPPRR